MLSRMLKLLIFFSVCLLVLLVGVSFLLFNSTVQKAAFLWMLEKETEELIGDILGVSESEVRAQGMDFSADAIGLKLKWLDFLWGRKLHIVEAEFHGIEVNLESLALASGSGLAGWLNLFEAGEQAAEGTWQGVLALLEQVMVDRFRLDGRVVLPGRQLVDLNLAVDDLAAGKKAAIRLQGGYRHEGEAVPVALATYKLDLQIDQSPEGSMEGVSGSMAIEMAGQSLQVHGDLLYAAGRSQPIVLHSGVAFKNIPSHILDFGQGAPISGTWNGSITVQGQAAKLEMLADSTRVSIDLEGSSGLLELTKFNQTAQKGANTLNLGAMLLGKVLNDPRFDAVSQMTQYLQRVPFDSVELNLTRYTHGKVDIRNFEILGPELMLSGRGSVDAQSWVSLAQGALNMNLTMGSKGSFGESATLLGLTGENRSGEYTLWRQPIHISGTLDNPNYSALKDMIFGALP